MRKEIFSRGGQILEYSRQQDHVSRGLWRGIGWENKCIYKIPKTTVLEYSHISAGGVEGGQLPR